MRDVDGRTRVCGLIGNPVEHTLSPLIHNTLAEYTEKNLIYVPFSVEADRLEAAVRGAYALHILGLNVTVPYKSAVIPYLEEVDELAKQIGAVNTLVRCEGGYKGYNTDMTGLKRAMESDGIYLEGESVILLGAGGAARAVAFLCAHAGAEKVWMLNRTLERADRVAEEVNSVFGRDCVTPLLLTDYDKIPKGKYVAVQGTSVGLHPDVEAAVVTDSAFYEKVHTGYDLVYKPGDTKFMQLVRAGGGRAFNGLKMLAWQGILAYELWNDIVVTKEQAQNIIEKLREKTKVYE
jgi:shikimate dehydrogenase